MLHTRILAVDDHPLILQGIENVIKENPEFEIIATASNGVEGLEFYKKYNPDLLIADVDMPKMNGIEMVEQIKIINPEALIVFLTSHVSLEGFSKALNLDYSGFLFKESVTDELADCLHAVVNGSQYTGKGVNEFIEANEIELERIAEINKAFHELTKTEIKILKLISQGRTTGQIADELFNSVKTIENHRYNICRKLEIDGANTLLCFAIENRIVVEKL